MEIRDWVQEAAGGQLSSADEALATVRRLEGRGSWSIEREEEWWYFLAGDQWLFRSKDDGEFGALVAGFAVAVATDPHRPPTERT